MRKTSVILLLSLFSIQLYAQHQNGARTLKDQSNPADAGFSAERLKRVDDLLQQYADSGWYNGAVGLIIRDGQVVYHKAVGYDDAGAKTPLKKDAIFRIASQTKAITSAAVMILYEEGKFRLDDPISLYIPEFKGQQVIDKYNMADSSYTTVPAKREVTIRDLLTHTSGIGYAQIGSREATAMYAKAGIIGGLGVIKYKLADQMKALAKLPLLHQPGERWTYGLNTDVLGYLVEILSKQSLDQFLRTRIFEPLGMKDTYFYLPADKRNRLVALYTEDTSTKKAVKMAETIKITETLYRDYPRYEGTYFSGGAGLSSTVYDYAIFLQMLLNGGSYNGKQLLSKNTVRLMTMNQIGDKPMGWGDNPNKFGLGFGITTERGSALLPANEGTFEWGGMFSTHYWVDPKEKIIGVVYRNIYPTSHWQFAEAFKVAVYQALIN